MKTLWQDVRFGLRMLGRSPSFTVIAILTLGLGIGASTAIFSVLNAVLLRPLPFPEADRLVHIYSLTLDISRSSEWNQRSTMYEEFATVSLPSGVTWTGPEGPEQPRALWVTPEFFSLLALRPQWGRPLLVEDTLPGGEPVAIVTHRFWRDKLGGLAGAVGRTLILNQKVHTIVGVLAEDSGILHTYEFDILLPLPKSAPGYIAYARLRPGVALESAQAEASAIAARLGVVPRSSPGGHAIFISSYVDSLVFYNQRVALLVLAGAIGFVLLIACVNVASLLIARASGRDREIAIRSALGAGRLRLVKQLLTESLLLSLVSAAAALLVARWCISFFLILQPYRIPRIQQATLDNTVFAFAVLLAASTSVLCGLVPALQATRVDLSLAFRAGAHGAGGTGTRQRIRSALVVTEVALATVLLLGAGLLVKTFLILRPANSGFDASNKLILRITLPEKFFPQPAQQAAFLRDASDRIGSLPGVRGVAVSTALPLVHMGGFTSGAMIDGKQVSPTPGPMNTFTPNVFYQTISPNYLRVMGMPVVAGRDFGAADAEGMLHVAIVNQTMARKFWPGESPLGQRVSVRRAGKETKYNIVGIVRDARIFASSSTPRPEFYIPYDQAPLDYLALVVHSDLDSSRLVPTVRAAIRSVNPDALVTNVQMYDKLLDEAVAGPRFHATLMSLLAGLAALSAVVGICGVIAYSLSQRTQEIGVRIALGARPADVLRMFLRQVLLLVAVGLVVGVSGAWGLTRYMRSLLYEVPPTDAATFAVVVLLWFAVAALACYVPARRVLRVDPIVALRYESLMF